MFELDLSVVLNLEPGVNTIILVIPPSILNSILNQFQFNFKLIFPICSKLNLALENFKQIPGLSLSQSELFFFLHIFLFPSCSSPTDLIYINSPLIFQPWALFPQSLFFFQTLPTKTERLKFLKIVQSYIKCRNTTP